MGRDKRPTIRKFEIKLSIPPKLVLFNMYKQATKLTLTEGLASFVPCRTGAHKRLQKLAYFDAFFENSRVCGQLRFVEFNFAFSFRGIQVCCVLWNQVCIERIKFSLCGIQV